MKSEYVDILIGSAYMYEAPEIARTEGGFIDDYCDIAIFATRSQCSLLFSHSDECHGITSRDKSASSENLV